jgi:hypothetical protein
MGIIGKLVVRGRVQQRECERRCMRLLLYSMEWCVFNMAIWMFTLMYDTFAAWPDLLRLTFLLLESVILKVEGYYIL